MGPFSGFMILACLLIGAGVVFLAPFFIMWEMIVERHKGMAWIVVPAWAVASLVTMLDWGYWGIRTLVEG